MGRIVRSVIRLGDPVMFMGAWGTALLIALFVLYPVFRVLAYPSATDFLAVLDHPRWLRAIVNTLVMTTLSTVTACLLGFVFALALTRPDLPGKGLFRTISILPLFSPPFAVAFSYLLLFGRLGLITHTVFHLRVDILGWRGLWLSQTISFFPIATLAISRVLENIPPSIEFVARNLGADEVSVFRTVTAPLARPGVAAAMLLVALYVLADFGNPLVIGGDFPILATEAWYQIEGWADQRAAAMLASLLLLPAALLFLLERRWVGRRLYTTILGRGARGERGPTPRGLRVFLVAFCSLVAIFVGLIYAGIVIGSLTRVWGADWHPTLRHWAEAVKRWPHVQNSLVVSGGAGVMAACLGFVTAYVARGRAVAGGAILGAGAVMPAAIPGVFLGIGYLLAFNGPPIPLAGTIWILILALSFWNLPFAYKTTAAGFRQIDRALEEAASNLGASWLRVLTDVYLPLLKRTAWVAFIATFVNSVTNLSITMFLVTARDVVATVSILALVSDNRLGAGAALTTLLLALTFAALALSFRWMGPDVLVA
ncbi:MAG: iron ABC transporter permease [Bacillati bacterium ANGP1]|uniref:Iron ABC transporter permease n=1 Tax=Candidatus Segetimicrobium genomatis TaxID=2569760 RepID=A0A537LWX3_9BACT|nr:MAG: iron ABC transporter permease [Terrabacteria group bacterium ANGP1]